MLFFICIIIVFIIILFLVAISELKINVKNLNISSLGPKLIKDGYLITVGLYIKKFPLIRFEFNKEKMRGLKLKDKLKKIDFQKQIQKIHNKKETVQSIKVWKINLEEIDLNIEFDTIDPVLTSYVTAIISSAIGIIFGILIRKYDKEKQKFVVEPMYINKNLINLSLSCIISVKIWNIIKEILNHRKLYFDNLKNTKAIQI